MAHTEGFKIEIRDPALDSLIQELSSLSPDWKTENQDYKRSQEILKGLGRDTYDEDREQAFHFMRLAWAEAAGLAEELELLSSKFDNKKSLTAQLGGLCLVKSSMEMAQYHLSLSR